MERVNKALDEVINCITNSNEYKECISLKNKMNDNEEVMSLIKKIKELQKKYIRSEYDSNIKKELDDCNDKLLNIPIYHMYNDSLEEVNEMISYVKDELNDYFNNLLNS